MLIVHLFVSYAHVNLCHFFSSSWCQGLAATSACGSSWTFLFTLFCVRLTGLSIAFSQDNNCVLAQTGIRNAEIKNFHTAFIKLAIEFRCHFIDFSILQCISYSSFRPSYLVCLFVFVPSLYVV